MIIGVVKSDRELTSNGDETGTHMMEEKDGI